MRALHLLMIIGLIIFGVLGRENEVWAEGVKNGNENGNGNDRGEKIEKGEREEKRESVGKECEKESEKEEKRERVGKESENARFGKLSASLHPEASGIKNGNENGNDRGEKKEKESEKGRQEKIARASDSLTLSFGKRVLYANGVMGVSSVTTLSGLFLYSGGLKNMEAMVSWRQFKSAWQKPPVMDYDAAFYNYGVHPYMGNLFYLASRDRGGRAASSFLVACITTVSFEYLIESFSQPPSINDLIVTPVLGSVVGECSYRLIRRMKADHHLSLVEKITYTLLDPAEVLRTGYKLPGKPHCVF